MQVVIAGGGPAGAVCARTLARAGIRTVLIEASPDGDKPCAGGIPSLVTSSYKIPDLLIKQKNPRVIFVAPSGLEVPAEFPDGGFIATVYRKEFDGHLRWAAEDAGAHVVQGRVLGYKEKGNLLLVQYKGPDGNVRTTEADFIVGADGAVSRIAKQAMGVSLPTVIGIQKEIRLPAETIKRFNNSCIFDFSTRVSPDFYGWIFPRPGSVILGIGTRAQNKSRLGEFLERMMERHADRLDGAEIIRRNGAMIPFGRYKFYGMRRVLLVGDAAGLVLPACGEGIYFAMRSGELAGQILIQYAKNRPDIVVSRYTDSVKGEFEAIFRYFTKIERIAYASPQNREIFVRLAQDKFMAKKMLAAWINKTRVRTPFFKKISIAFDLSAIRSKVAQLKNLE